MTEFKRLISYLYEYEGKVKGKNVGFVKLETRNGLCKLNVSLRKIYLGSGNLGVYLLSARQEIFLGNLNLRNGGGEFRTAVQAADIEQSGVGMDDCYGLTVHEKKDSWKVYTTIWDDHRAQAAQLTVVQAETEEAENKQAEERRQSQEGRKRSEAEEEAEVQAAELAAVQEAGVFSRQAQEAIPQTENEHCTEPEPGEKWTENEQEKAETAEEREEPEKAEMPKERKEPEKVNEPERMKEPEKVNAVEEKKEPEKIDAGEAEKQRERTVGIAGRKEAAGTITPVSRSPQNPGNRFPRSRMNNYTMTPRRPAGMPRENLQMERPQPSVQQPMNRPPLTRQPGSSQPPAQQPGKSQPLPQQPFIRHQEEEPLIIGDPEALAKLEEEEKAPPVPLWDFLSKTYPKIQAFESQYGCEILVIKPQDIGLLPREVWVYGNNSFLLHGYYNYRYLILARLENPQGFPRYLLGVPGHYYNNEKYMASMFGFPNFVLSKKQQAQDGRFGYWYTDIRLGDQNVAAAAVRRVQSD